MEIRKLLRSYGIRNFNLPNQCQIMVRKKRRRTTIFFQLYSAKFSIVEFFQTLIRYILKQDLPTSLNDSLMLAEAYKFPTPQIHYFYIIQLTRHGKV